MFWFDVNESMCRISVDKDMNLEDCDVVLMIRSIPPQLILPPFFITLATIRHRNENLKIGDAMFGRRWFNTLV